MNLVAPRIMENVYVHADVDMLVRRIKMIVNAWADSTGQNLAKTYEEEFGWPPGDGYYGAFDMTARNIADILYNKGKQPLRAKLKLIYNVIRNNNLSKWLKIAALELDREAKLQTARDIKIKTATKNVRDQNENIIRGIAKKLTVRRGFARKSGLKEWLTNKRRDLFAGFARSEKKTEPSNSERDVFGHDLRSEIMDLSQDNKDADLERRINVSGGLSVDQQNTLKSQDVQDLTDQEIDLLYKRQNKPKPDETERSRFRNDPSSKILWSQGGEYYDVKLGSQSAKTAQRFKARLEAGISGSTDLMLHAAQNLGIDNEYILKGLRLGLAGWMIANRDHSFYEVYKAAESYGLDFDIDESEPGKEYESEDNLYPMEKEDFANILPEGFPRHFLSSTYKDELANSLNDADQDKNSFKTALKDQGLSDEMLNDLDERAIAELSRLSDLVSNMTLRFNQSISQRRQIVRRVKLKNCFIYLGNTLGEEKANKLINALIKHHHHGNYGFNSPSDTKLEQDIQVNDRKESLLDAGVPNYILEKLNDDQLKYLDNIRKNMHIYFQYANAEAHRHILGLMPIITYDDTLAIWSVLMQTYWGNHNIHDPGLQQMADTTRFKTRLEEIAKMETTSGWWYSWGPEGYLQGLAGAPSIRQATSTVPSTQGPGMYVAENAWKSQGYGDTLGFRVLAVHFDGVPTINSNNAAQMAELSKLTGKSKLSGEDFLEKTGLYNKNNVIEMLLRYGTGSFARLTTNKGVAARTFNLSIPPLELLKSDYAKLSGVPKQNFKAQAIASGVGDHFKDSVPVSSNGGRRNMNFILGLNQRNQS